MTALSLFLRLLLSKALLRVASIAFLVRDQAFKCPLSVAHSKLLYSN